MKGAPEARFMRRALALARRGIPAASPNPFVGCVLARGRRVVGEGWHAAFGGPHAERAALAAAGARARGATAYVNIEPCCHERKKTPPCAPALVSAGVRRVVAGTADPNPKVSGRGFEALRRSGLRVTVGVLSEECSALNRPFSVRMRTGRPYVILKAATSLDGRVAAASGRSKWITSPAARAAARRMRGEVDAILVGVGTVLADDPSLTAHGLGRDPLRVVLDSRLRTPAGAKVLAGTASTVILTGKIGFRRSKGRVPANVGVVEVRGGGRRLDLREALGVLGKMGIGTVLVEGGSRVHTSFLEAGLADELRLFVAPKLIGGEDSPAFFEGRGAKDPASAKAVSELRARRVGPDLLLSGYL